MNSRARGLWTYEDGKNGGRPCRVRVWRAKLKTSPLEGAFPRLMKHLLVVILLVAILLLLMKANLPAEPYVYDEADYMYAAAFGFFANYSDTPTLAAAAF